MNSSWTRLSRARPKKPSTSPRQNQRMPEGPQMDQRIVVRLSVAGPANARGGWGFEWDNDRKGTYREEGGRGESNTKSGGRDPRRPGPDARLVPEGRPTAADGPSRRLQRCFLPPRRMWSTASGHRFSAGSLRGIRSRPTGARLVERYGICGPLPHVRRVDPFHNP